ncbi:YlaI family protein [Solibacillus sp. FSL H8-0538]|uniref:YlaI family protein n=1 Tax=Solibacillus sp. FSL H8-0538 TaxID=2921400 RepID=UPI0030FBCACB
MRVKCVICDVINNLEDDLPLAKKLRNRPIHTYMCTPCQTRISENTDTRLATGKFRFFRTSSKLDEEF